MKHILLTLPVLISWPGDATSQFNLFSGAAPPSPYAQQQFNRVLVALDYQGPPIALWKSPYVQNAVATVLQIGIEQGPLGPRPVYSRVILYSPVFMNSVDLTSGNRFAALAVLAHEVGHHLGGHVDGSDPYAALQHPWIRELEADYYSGLALARLEAKPSDLQAAQRVAFSLWGSPSHPDSWNRIRQLLSGWKAGGGTGVTAAELDAIRRSLVEDLTKW